MSWFSYNPFFCTNALPNDSDKNTLEDSTGKDCEPIYIKREDSDNGNN